MASASTSGDESEIGDSNLSWYTGSLTLNSSVKDPASDPANDPAQVSLAIDTTGSKAFVAAINGDAFAQVTCHDQLSHDERLYDLVESALQRVASHPTQITRLVVGLGPGSFTGVRIGLSFASGLAAGRNLQLRGYSTMCALLWEATATHHQAIAAVDARRNEWFITHNPEVPFRSQLTSPTPQSIPLLDNPQTAINLATTEAVLTQLNQSTSVLAPILALAEHRTEFDQANTFICNRIALSLLEIDSYRSDSATQISGPLDPIYIRRVSAKTINERLADKKPSPP